MAKTKAPCLKEIDIQIACVDFMRLDGWRPLRTDPCSDRARGKGFGEKGMADHLFIRYLDKAQLQCICERRMVLKAPAAEVLWVEFKRPGGKICNHQSLWNAAERAAGAMTVCAIVDFEPTFDGFVAWYRCSGLLRRQGL